MCRLQNMVKKVVRKYTKHKNYWEHCKNKVSFTGTTWSSMDQKKSKNGHFSQRLVFFTLSLGFADVFGRRSYPKRPKTPFWARGPNHALEKVLTSKTPCMYFYKIQGVAVSWIFSFRIKFVGLEVILGVV